MHTAPQYSHRSSLSVSRPAPAKGDGMTAQIQLDSTPRFSALPEQALPSRRAALRLARVVGWAGTFGLTLMLVFAFFPDAVAPYDATERVALPLQRPSGENILGTNDLGQDLLSELIAGTR